MTKNSTTGEWLVWAYEKLSHLEFHERQASAQVLLAKVLNRPRATLAIFPEKSVNPSQGEQFSNLILTRAKHIPVSYITGEREFYGENLKVGDGCLIPRPETETLIDYILEEIYPHRGASSPLTVLDAGTGSGAIIATLANHLSGNFHATDLSADALSWARINTENTANKVHLYRMDLIGGFTHETFDLIVSNPPYLSDVEWQNIPDDVKLSEPKIALMSEDSGKRHLIRLMESAYDLLRPGGHLIMEGNPLFNASLLKLSPAKNYNPKFIFNDLAGEPRFLRLTKTGRVEA